MKQITPKSRTLSRLKNSTPIKEIRARKQIVHGKNKLSPKEVKSQGRVYQTRICYTQINDLLCAK